MRIKEQNKYYAQIDQSRSTFFLSHTLFIPYIATHGHTYVGVVVAVIVWQLDLQLPMQSVPIITNVLSSNPAHAMCARYTIQHYVIKFVIDLLQVGGFLLLLRFPSSIKAPRYNWNFVESAVKHHRQTSKQTNKQTSYLYIYFEFLTFSFAIIPLRQTSEDDGLSGSRIPYIVVMPSDKDGGRYLGTDKQTMHNIYQTSTRL